MDHRNASTNICISAGTAYTIYLQFSIKSWPEPADWQEASPKLISLLHCGYSVLASGAWASGCSSGGVNSGHGWARPGRSRSNILRFSFVRLLGIIYSENLINSDGAYLTGGIEYSATSPPPAGLRLPMRFHAPPKSEAMKRRKRSVFWRSLCRLLTNLYDMSLKQHTDLGAGGACIDAHTHTVARLSLSANRKFNGLMMGRPRNRR